jgi:hypothetical protein
MAVGGAVQDAEAKEVADALRGKDAAAADALLGPRLETLVVADNPDRKLLIYAVPGEKDPDVHYTVELRDKQVTVVSKNKFGDDPKMIAKLREDLLGKTVAECEQIEGVADPKIVLRSVERDQTVRAYDSSNILKGTRYLVLRFDEHGSCIDVDTVALSGSSQKGGIIKGGE